MNADRVAAALPLLAGHPDLWGEPVGRAVAVAAGRRLLRNGAEAAWNGTVFGLLLADPAVGGIAAGLGCAPGALEWKRAQVARALVAWFGLHGSWRWLYDRMPRR